MTNKERCTILLDGFTDAQLENAAAMLEAVRNSAQGVAAASLPGSRADGDAVDMKGACLDGAAAYLDGLDGITADQFLTALHA